MHPSEASNQLFVTPFAVNPNNEDVMIYAAGSTLWRHADLSGIRSGQTDREGITEGWARLSDLPSPAPRVISAMAFSMAPAHVLYYGASDIRDDNALAPRLFRVDDAEAAPQVARDITPAGLPAGSYIADVAVIPLDADELLVVLSNYNILGLFHSRDGGRQFAAVEGDLAGTDDLPGPSLRSAAILTQDGVTSYYVGTSAGLFTTSDLNGLATRWTPEAEVENAVVWDVAARQSDGMVAVATHGRGLFLASPDPGFNPLPDPDAFLLAQNYPNPFATTTRIAFDLPEQSSVSLAVYDLAGRRVAVLLDAAAQDEGRREVAFDAAGLASGTYLYHMVVTPLAGTSRGASFSRTRKMMIIK